MRGRVDGPWIQLLDDRPEPRGEGGGEPASEVELLATALGGQRQSQPGPSSSAIDVTGSTRAAIRRPR